MKKNAVFVILLIGLIAASCSEKAPFGVKVANNLGLTSISRSGDNSYTINFYQGKPIDIQYGTSHDEFEYHSGLIYKWLSFDHENKLTLTVIYSYDAMGRIASIEYNPTKPPLWGDTLTNTTNYTDNQIVSIWNSRHGYIRKSKMTLNQQGVIIMDEVSHLDGTINSTKYAYSNGNLTSCTLSNSKNSETEFRSFTYLNKKNSYYNYYKKFLFGAEWKNNSAIDFPDNNLDYHFLNPFSQSVYPQVSQNLISTYSMGKVSASVGHEFDHEDNLKTQIEELTFADGSKRTIITYFIYKYGP